MADQVQRREEEEILPPSTWIWSWGAGTHGQLASGAFTDHLEPLPLTWYGMEIGSSVEAACCPKILDMAGGGAHAVAVLGSNGHGQVVTWGNGQSGALGHGDESDLSIPKLVKYFQGIQICSVAAGWSHTAFVADSGELYTCGSGSFGQLGHGDLEAQLVPTKVNTLPCKAVSMAACGMRHTLVLAHGTRTGVEVYGFGSSKRGQLGIGTLDNLKTNQHSFKNTGKVSVPQWITSLSEHQIVLLAANGDHSAALSETGSLYLWGRGFNGSPDASVPAQVGSQLRFSQVALGWNHCIALADGQLWAWGNNHRGQLGILAGSASESSSLTSTSDISKDSETAAIPFVGNAQIITSKTQGALTAADTDICIKHRKGVIVSQSIPSLSFCKQVDMHASAAATSKEQIALGTGSFAVGCKSENHWPEMLRVGGLEGKIVGWLSAGAEHSAIVLNDGRIMVWGWGEHGQLGLGTDEDQLYPEVVSIPSIPLEGELRWRTFCGSGFTFAVAEHSAKA